MLEIKIKGGAEVAALMQQLPVELETKLLRSALHKGAVVVRDEARLRAPKSSRTEPNDEPGGKLRAGIKTSSDRKNGRVVAKVKATGYHAFLAHIYEYGADAYSGETYERKDAGRRSGRKKTKRGTEVKTDGNDWFGRFPDKAEVPAQPFLRPALDAKAAEAINVIGAFLGQYLQFGAISAPVIKADIEE